MEPLEESPHLSPGSAAIWTWRADRQAIRAASAAARRRGLVQAAVGLGVAAALWPWRPPAAYAVAAVALAVALLAMVSPRGGYRRLTNLTRRFGHAVGVAVTWILLPLLYYPLFVPLGLFLRRGGRLRITRAPDPALDSYWLADPPAPRTPEAFRRQF